MNGVVTGVIPWNFAVNAREKTQAKSAHILIMSAGRTTR